MAFLTCYGVGQAVVILLQAWLVVEGVIGTVEVSLLLVVL